MYKYRIEKDPNGFFIKERIKFLFWSWWKTIREHNLWLNGDFTFETLDVKYYQTYKQAEEWLRKVV